MIWCYFATQRFTNDTMLKKFCTRADTESDRHCRTEWGWLARLKGLPEDLPLPPYHGLLVLQSHQGQLHGKWTGGQGPWQHWQEEAAWTVTKADPRCGAVHPLPSTMLVCVERERERGRERK